ncbi:MAG: hypothetical protein KDB03_28060 [Planctomycetales bacterium]|nr:hypothetical protein [Planctomycetales bacterium]
MIRVRLEAWTARSIYYPTCFLACMLATVCEGVADDSVTNSCQISTDAVAIAKFIEQLDDQRFAVRESATESLFECGKAAIDLLRRTLQGNCSNERTWRVQWILQRIEEKEFAERSHRFLASRDPNDEFDFPGWASFCQVAGYSHASKLLFLQVCQCQPELAGHIEKLSACSQDERDGALRAVNQFACAKAFELHENDFRSFSEDRPIRPGDLVALLWAAGLNPSLAPMEVNEQIIESLQRSFFSEYLIKVGYQQSVRNLLSVWVPKTQEVVADRVLNIAILQELPEGAGLARKLLGSNVDSRTRAAAFQCLAKYGTASDLSLVEMHINDNTIVYEFAGELSPSENGILESNQPPPGVPSLSPPAEEVSYMVVRIGDCALATCLLLCPARDVEMEEFFPRFESSSLFAYSLRGLAGPARTDRRADNIRWWQELRDLALNEN